MKISYEKIGLKVGLEVHQQLDSSTKLFCNCKPQLFKDEPTTTLLRRLRPTQSELGQVDPAAYFEFQKGVKILYEANDATSCLVEMDEEPPHPLNMEAVEIALTAAIMMEADPVDEIHVMRKTVIDGSNTTGFQRTCVIALDGEIEVQGKTIPIQHIGLEEDAARKTGGEGEIVRYRIDRLGVPLVEVATAPVIGSPREAQEVALAIGRVLRATGKVRRGLGTIRQDVNISIPSGALVEIKGVQQLDLLELVTENEVQRQLKLLNIQEKLKSRGVKKKDIEEEFFDVTGVFKETECKILSKALEKKQQILAVRLPRFKDLLKHELVPGFRFGTEMADRACFWGRVGGIFHTDELPAYGITREEVEELKKAVGAGRQDAVVIVADDQENAEDALRAVVERSREALEGVPEETRAARPDGATRYMRPRPGAARMYPETDIPPIQITEEQVERLRSFLPELPESKLKRLMKDYGLNQKLTRQVLDAQYSELFENIVKDTNVSPTTVAVFLTETLRSLKRDGVQTEKISKRQIREIFTLVDSGDLTREAIPDVAIWLAKRHHKGVKEAIRSLDLKVISGDELKAFIEKVIQENRSLIQKRGENSFAALMGLVMKKLRGRVDARSASKMLKEELKQQMNTRHT